MKKVLIFIICLMGAGILQAQQDNMQWFSGGFTYQQNENLDKYITWKKPWQAALFLGVELRPTEETLHVLQEQIEQGYLKRATVISFTEDVPTLYILSASENTQITLSSEAPIEELFNQLLQPLENTSSLYTALLVNARSHDGYAIRYADTKIFALSQMLQPLTESQLYIDVLDLQICHMGNLFNVYQLTTSERVRYALLSSERRRGSRQLMHYHLIRHFNDTPQEAALAASKDAIEQFDFSRDRHSHNLLVLDIKQLKSPLKQWFQLTDDDTMYTTLEHPLSEMLNEKYSFFMADQLIKPLQQAILAQWCYSAPMHQLYQDNIPLDAGCINGLF